jgi:hypothetical protein
MFINVGTIFKMQGFEMASQVRRLVCYTGSRNEVGLLVFAYLIGETNNRGLEDMDGSFGTEVREQVDADIAAREMPLEQERLD